MTPAPDPADDFGSRLSTVLAASGRLCVGIDPHPHLLAGWNLPDSAAGVREFGLRVVDAMQGAAGIVKPQVAFFERHAAAGYQALEEVLAAARGAGLLVIADAKRGDIGTSVDAYGEAWLTPGSPLEADAVTLSAYQGLASAAGLLDAADGAGKGVFVLAATSNPEAVAVQTARLTDGPDAGRTVAAAIVAEVGRRNGNRAAGAVGVVLGATVRREDYGIGDEDLEGVPVLAPGFGHQGAPLGDLSRLYGAAARLTVASVSRSVLSAGPDALPEAIRRAAGEVR